MTEATVGIKREYHPERHTPVWYVGYNFNGNMVSIIGCVEASVIKGLYDIYLTSNKVKKIGTAHGVRDAVIVLAILGGFKAEDVPQEDD